ncbi:sialate O-acetylesterase [Algibacter amylolyticus]|uniref:Sialate O-acetylesterase n=1 Tax=Algibacter amylolyticus TaxID=1608400 RepID=A0A5M7BA01_9FLAO|nr:sialate O-acetylesterase [Algibacter amylolyticus]KAA5825148.1 sialate O-acetylesterase [Algibacter amylolyticus]MBB5268743.1 sialate O-acetylesterase [Algibacter amylolyticus]TSJ77642.1 sialate O-acetylesterase [Algibacter amylolyticus]
MRSIKLISLVGVLFLLVIESIHAEVKLPAIVSSNMVLQRNTTIVLWGWADANEKVTINASWLVEQINVQADKEGSWRIEVKTTNSKASQSIKIYSENSDIILENILFGEVWLCSGQSNMEQPIKGYEGQPTFGAVMATAKSNNANLRLFTVDKVGSKTPLNTIEKFTGWQQSSPLSVSNFSAVAYFFGEQLQEILDCPVGMIHTSWGNSSVQAWMSKAVLSSHQNVNLDDVDITKRTQRIPTALFNSMINPLIPYTVKGVLWYQGEANRKEPEQYKTLFPAMVKDWRARWEIGDFPFYYVQIAPFLYGNNDVFQTVDNSAFIREAQLECLDLIPNSGIAITMDIGDKHGIHPPKKKEVANRLLFNALNQTYGYKTIDYAAPIYESLDIKGSGITLKFKNADNGLYAHNDLEGFEIAGSDKVFYPASAKIVKRKNVFIKSDRVPNPVAVRYAWRNWVMGTLYGTNLLPVSSFRTDQWIDAKQANSNN